MFYETTIEMTGKRSVKTNLNMNNENGHHNFPYNSCGYVEQNLSNLQLLLKFQSPQDLIECFEKIDKTDDNLIAFQK